MKITNLKIQQGQTLIETMVAAVVLVMGISAAVGLAIYGLGATTSVTKQLVATGLAREGIEAVKNMRDTNWLSTDISGNCYDFYTGTSIANCYPDWLTGASGNGYSIITNGSRDTEEYFVLNFNADNQENQYWSLTPSNSYGLDLDVNNPTQGAYKANGDDFGNSGFSRKITLSTQSFAPFDQNLGPRLKVHVDVWWADKRCPRSAGVPTSSSCKISLETYLTNWKNY